MTPGAGGLSPEFVRFLAMELAASVTRQHQALFVPGLLQTRDYGHAIFEAHGADATLAYSRMNLRVRRQQILGDDAGPQFFFVLNETVLRRRFGGVAVMRAQLDQLVGLNRRPNVHIQLLSRLQVGHPAAEESFTLLEFPTGPEVLQLEGVTKDVLVEDDPERAAEYRARFDTLQALAHPADRLDVALAPLLDDLRP